MNYKHFEINIEDNVATLSINRIDKANALHMPAWEEMKGIFENLDADDNVRVIILKGNGAHFCAGIDLETLMSIQSYNAIKCEGRKRESLRAFIFKLQEAINAIEKCRKPVLAAVHKACIGGGLDIIAACDMRYCSEGAYFSVKEIDLGLVADLGSLQRLPQIIGPGMVSEMAYTGRNVEAKEAQRISLVNNIYSSKEELFKSVEDIAKTIAKKSPLCIRGIKEMLLYKRDHTVQDSLNYAVAWNASMLFSDDLMEAFSAKMEKREAEYK